jgi:hypothetical protein
VEDANHYWPSQRHINGGLWGTVGDMGGLLLWGGGEITKILDQAGTCVGGGAMARRLPPLGVCVIRLLWG